jgi:hypothetical protein
MPGATSSFSTQGLWTCRGIAEGVSSGPGRMIPGLDGFLNLPSVGIRHGIVMTQTSHHGGEHEGIDEVL